MKDSNLKLDDSTTMKCIEKKELAGMLYTLADDTSILSAFQKGTRRRLIPSTDRLCAIKG